MGLQGESTNGQILLDQDPVLTSVEDVGFLQNSYWREALETPLPRQCNTTRDPDDFQINTPGVNPAQEFETFLEHLDAGNMDALDLTLTASNHNHKHRQTKDGMQVSETSSRSVFSSPQAVDLDEIQRCYFNPSPSSPDVPSLIEDVLNPASDCSSHCTEAGGLQSLTPSPSKTLQSIRKRKTILTIENLDPETRSTILNLLCERELSTSIEIVGEASEN